MDHSNIEQKVTCSNGMNVQQLNVIAQNGLAEKGMEQTPNICFVSVYQHFFILPKFKRKGLCKELVPDSHHNSCWALWIKIGPLNKGGVPSILKSLNPEHPTPRILFYFQVGEEPENPKLIWFPFKLCLPWSWIAPTLRAPADAGHEAHPGQRDSEVKLHMKSFGFGQSVYKLQKHCVEGLGYC